MNAIYQRYSHKTTFTATPVTREQLTEIIRAGIAAPSGRNAQTTEFIGVDDPALLRALGEIIAAPPALTAQASIVVVTEPQVTFKGMSFHVQDYAAAIENMLLAITQMGLASVWEEGMARSEGRDARIATLLNVPAHKQVVCYLPIGVPQVWGSPAQRKPFHERAWFNGYQKK